MALKSTTYKLIEKQNLLETIFNGHKFCIRLYRYIMHWSYPETNLVPSVSHVSSHSLMW